MKGNSRVSTRIQLRASRSGASSGSGNDGWLRRTHSLEVTARISVSRLARLLSRVRRISAGEKREKTSSVDSGSSQNYAHAVVVSPEHATSKQKAYPSPVGVVGGDLLGLRQAEDALLEGEFRVGGAHQNACHIACGGCAEVLMCSVVNRETRMQTRQTAGGTQPATAAHMLTRLPSAGALHGAEDRLHNLSALSICSLFPLHTSVQRISLQQWTSTHSFALRQY